MDRKRPNERLQAASRLALTFIVLIHVWIACAGASLLASSKLTICERNVPTNTDAWLNCNQRLLSTLSIRNGQGATEQLIATVEKVHDDISGREASLARPLRITATKSRSLVTYNLATYTKGGQEDQYPDGPSLGEVNHLPYEEVIYTTGRLPSIGDAEEPRYDCKDGYNDPQVACDFKFLWNGTRIFDSQGICCFCTDDEINNLSNHFRRSNLKCEDGGIGFEPINAPRPILDSAHCLRFSPLNYTILSISEPYVEYTINIAVEELQQTQITAGQAPQQTYKRLSDIKLSPFQPVGASPGRRVVAEVVGDLLPARSFYELQNKFLLFPRFDQLNLQIIRDHPEYIDQFNAGQDGWIVIDKKDVDVTGKTCNKIGVGFIGFSTQESACVSPQGTCLEAQPAHIWADMQKNLAKGIVTENFLSYYNIDTFYFPPHGAWLPQSVSHTDTQTRNTIVALQIDAQTLSIIRSRSAGKIIDTLTTNVTALEKGGRLSVTVQNVGSVAADFYISIGGCLGNLQPVPAQAVTLEVQQTSTLVFDLETFDSEGGVASCTVTLQDQAYEVVDNRRVNFTIEETCFCFQECGCTCDAGGVMCPPPRITLSNSTSTGSPFTRFWDGVGDFFGGLYTTVLAGLASTVMGLVGLGALKALLSRLPSFPTVGSKLPKIPKGAPTSNGTVVQRTARCTACASDTTQGFFKNVKSRQKVDFLMALLFFVALPVMGLFWLLKRFVSALRETFEQVYAERDLLMRKSVIVIRLQEEKDKTAGYLGDAHCEETNDVTPSHLLFNIAELPRNLAEREKHDLALYLSATRTLTSQHRSQPYAVEFASLDALLLHTGLVYLNFPSIVSQHILCRLKKVEHSVSICGTVKLCDDGSNDIEFDCGRHFMQVARVDRNGVAVLMKPLLIPNSIARSRISRLQALSFVTRRPLYPCTNYMPGIDESDPRT